MENLMKRYLLFILCFCFSALTFAKPVKEIIFFGDSLSDNGNLYQSLKIIPKSPPYYQGRFSNGPTWAEFVANYAYQQNLASSSNYAVGGATSIVHSPINDIYFYPMTLTIEIYHYLYKSVLHDKSNTLYSFWIGGNDYLFDFGSDPDLLTTEVVDGIILSMNRLIAHGAKQFLVLNMPDLSQTPYANMFNNKARLHTLSTYHNEKLSKELIVLKKDNPQITITYIDANALFMDLLANPSKYKQKYRVNLTNIKDTCWPGLVLIKDNSKQLTAKITMALEQAFNGSANFNNEQMTNLISKNPVFKQAFEAGDLYDAGMRPCPNPEQFFFWDMVHPTAIIHQIIGQIAIDNLKDKGILS
jgi:phospholipase/lecithinase/hemolysin